MVRTPVVAGQFYPDSPIQCRSEARQFTAIPPQSAGLDQHFQPIGGIVPHAGWICSGAVAGEVIAVLGRRISVQTWVVFGAVHRVSGPQAAVFVDEAWETPLGTIPIDLELANAIATGSRVCSEGSSLHNWEHSIEVQVPFIQHAAIDARLVAIMVPPSDSAAEVGREAARQAKKLGRTVAFVGSSDLTHYGPRYDFTPHGPGAVGVKWAKEVNDQRMIELITALRADEVVREARARQNACGSGAIAACLAAAVEAGATGGRVLRHTNSCETLAQYQTSGQDAVGYAGIVLGWDIPE